MRLFFNLLTAWLSIVLLIAVTIIWILRILVKRQVVKKGSFLFNANRNLRRYHKSIGIAFLVIAVIHAILSSTKLFSVNWGSACILGIAVMSASYIIKSKIKRKIWINIHRILCVSVIAILIIHLLDVGIVAHKLIKNTLFENENQYHMQQEEIDKIEEDINDDLIEDNQRDENGNGDSNEYDKNNKDDTQQNEVVEETTGTTYKAGTYTGVAQGFGPNLTVEVTIKDNEMTDIVVVSHNEVNEAFWGEPVEVIPQRIVENQSVEVDSVSGATYTSTGIKNAVIDALTQALISGELPAEQQATSRGRGH